MVLRLLVLLVAAGAVGVAVWALRRYTAAARPATRFELADAGGSAPVLVTFTGPWCLECQEIRPRLQAASSARGVPLAVIDIKQQPELAAKYDVRLTPTTLAVGPGGRVAAGWLGTPPDGAVEDALGALVGAGRR